MGTYLADIKAKNAAGANPPIAAQFVVYDLPDRDCAALASNGEYSIANGGVANYKKYIDAIRAQLLNYPDVHTILVIGMFVAMIVHSLSILTSARTRQLSQPGHQPERGQMRQRPERLSGVRQLRAYPAEPAQCRHVYRCRYAYHLVSCVLLTHIHRTRRLARMARQHQPRRPTLRRSIQGRWRSRRAARPGHQRRQLQRLQHQHLPVIHIRQLQLR